METESALIFKSSDGDFESAVLERSTRVPVVVDFWAEWCGPCRELGPLLEKLTVEHAGDFVLAKVDIERSPQLATSFGVRSIPMVLGFRDRLPVASFVGAQPEASIRDFLAQLLPTPAQRLVRQAHTTQEAGNIGSAESMLREALALDPRCDQAMLALAEILHDTGDSVGALELLEGISPGTEERKAGDRLSTEIKIQSAAGADVAALEQRLAGDPSDSAARFELAQALAARSSYAEALEHCLELVRSDRSFQDDAGRKMMLEIFDLLGSDHELTEKYRGTLAKLLFR